jgi:hypothetical protein
VGSGVDSRGRSKTDLNASDECSDGSFALHGALSGQAQGGGSAIGILSRFARKDFTSANAIVGSDIEPGAKMLFAGSAVHVQTDFGQDPFNCQQIQSRQFG